MHSAHQIELIVVLQGIISLMGKNQPEFFRHPENYPLKARNIFIHNDSGKTQKGRRLHNVLRSTLTEENTAVHVMVRSCNDIGSGEIAENRPDLALSLRDRVHNG